MLNETSEELVQLPKTTRLTQSEKKLALEGYVRWPKPSTGQF